MSGFQPGDIVDITIKGARVAIGSDRDPCGHIVIDADDNNRYAMPPQAAVTRAAQTFEQNALYADRSGHLWLAQQGADEGDGIHLHSSLGSCSIEQATEWYGPFRLVHREEAS